MHSSTPPPSAPQISDEPALPPPPPPLPPLPPPPLLPHSDFVAGMGKARMLSEGLHALAVGANSAARVMPRANLRRQVIAMSLQLCEVLDRLQPPENGPVLDEPGSALEG